MNYHSRMSASFESHDDSADDLRDKGMRQGEGGRLSVPGVPGNSILPHDRIAIKHDTRLATGLAASNQRVKRLPKQVSWGILLSFAMLPLFTRILFF